MWKHYHSVNELILVNSPDAFISLYNISISVSKNLNPSQTSVFDLLSTLIQRHAISICYLSLSSAVYLLYFKDSIDHTIVRICSINEIIAICISLTYMHSIWSEEYTDNTVSPTTRACIVTR